MTCAPGQWKNFVLTLADPATYRLDLQEIARSLAARRDTNPKRPFRIIEKRQQGMYDYAGLTPAMAADRGPSPGAPGSP